MTQTEQYRGVPGMLRPFKEFVEAAGLKAGDQVAYYGVPGTCTPFIELLAFALRSLDLEQIFVPLLDEGKARTLGQVSDVGMQASDAPAAVDPKVIVVMGGLSMPGVPVEAGSVRAIIDSHPGAKVVGVCFMHMFEKAGWLRAISFDCLIDATIDPVEVTNRPLIMVV